MAIVRVDLDTDGEETGWSWPGFNGDIEKIVVNSTNRGVAFSAETHRVEHYIRRDEIQHWIKALTKAQKYFDGLEENNND